MKIFILYFLFSLTLIAQHNNLQNRYMLGRNFEVSGDYEKAADIFRELHQSQPENFQYFESLNRMYIQMKRYDSSIAIIKRRLESSPMDPNLTGLLGKTYFMMGEDKKALEIYDDFLAGTEHTNSYQVIANYCIQMRLFDEAIEYLREAQEINPAADYISFDLAYLYSVQMNFTASAEEYAKLLKNKPDQVLSIQNRLLNHFGGNNDAFYAAIEVFKKYEPEENFQFAGLLASMYIEVDEYDEAFNLYKQIDEIRDKQGEELLHFALTLYREEEYGIASEVFRYLMEKYPHSKSSAAIDIGYAKSREMILIESSRTDTLNWKPYSTFYIENKEPFEEVINKYLEISVEYISNEYAAEALYRLGELYLLMRLPAESESAFTRLYNQMSWSRYYAPACIELGRININKENFEAAEKYIKEVFSAPAFESVHINEARFLLAKTDFYKGDFTAAQKNITAVIGQLRDDRANDAIELAMLLNKTLNDSTLLAEYAHGELLIDKREFEEAADLFNEIAQSQNAFFLSQLSLLKAAELKIQLELYDDAVVILNRLVEMENSMYSDRSLMMLGKIYHYGTGNTEKALETYRILLSSYPESLYLDEAREEIITLRDKTS